MKYLAFFFLLIQLYSCQEENKTEMSQSLSAQQIIDKAIKNTCSGNCDKAIVEFGFRDKLYKSTRDGGSYQLERIKKEGDDIVQDIISNDGFKRFINEKEIRVQDSMVTKISDGVNSVHYFAQLPFGLNATAVNNKLLGEDTINNKDYYEVEITFKKEGGGTDFDDVFVYWINKETYDVDYLAYSYATNGGGIRFREAYNPRIIEGIRFVDYNNYKTDDLNVSLFKLDDLFMKNELKLLSKIETENVKVILLK